MADLSLTFGSFSAIGPPLKRKRIDANEGQTPSKIDDKRICTGDALKLDCDFLTIVVGKGECQKSFKIHEDILCERSEFFRNSMKPEWASMRDDPRVIELPEDDPEAFSLYRTWLYSGKLAVFAHNGHSSSDSEQEPERQPTLAYAYVLGERFMDTEFKNDIADAYVLAARGVVKRGYPTNEEIRILYDGTREDSPIRQLLVDIWYTRGKVEWIEKDADLPKEFLASVVKELLRVRIGVENLSRPWKNSHEQYHDK